MVFWGVRYFQCPLRLGEIMMSVCKKRFNLSDTEAREKVQNGFNEQRTRSRCKSRVRKICRMYGKNRLILILLLSSQDVILEKRREPGAHPIFDLLLKEEMMKAAKHSRIISSECPFDKGEQAMTDYAMIYAKDVEEAYKVR